MIRNLMKIVLCQCVCMFLFAINIVLAKTEPLDFWVNPDGQIFQLNLIKKKTFTTGRGFPFWNKPVGLSVTDFKTGKELAKLCPEGKRTSPLGAYWLDSDRVVFNLLDDNGPRKYHTGIWDIQTKTHHLYQRTGSGAYGAVSGIDANELMVVSCPYSELDGMLLHDLNHGTNTQLLKGFVVYSPRFAPNSLRFAAFACSKHTMLVLHTVGQSKSQEVMIDKYKNNQLSGRDLRWSHSGKYIAGIVYHDDVAFLYIWASDGKEISQIPLPSNHMSIGWSPMDYAPTWLPADKGMIIFFQGEKEQIQQKIFSIVELGLQ